MKLHVVINLYNDRVFLAACLESIRDIVDSIIVVDGAYQIYLEHFREFSRWATAWSTDGSLEILQNFRGLPELHILKTPNDQICWPSQIDKRNFMINQVPEGDCFLIIDADEMIMGDAQEALEKFYESGCVAAQMPLYTPGLQVDRVIPKWHPRVFMKRPGMHYKGTHWHLRDKQTRIIEEKYPMFWTDLMAIVHFKAFKDQTRLIPHQNYMLALAERGWIEPTPGGDQKKEERMLWKENPLSK
jgi:glycosyltransferase involved in cell wall biosynthesis